MNTRTDEIEYVLNDSEMETIGNLTLAKVDSLMLLVKYRFHSEGQEVELHEFKTYSAHLVNTNRWFRVADELDSMLSALLDETKIIDSVVEFMDSEKQRAEDTRVSVIVDERRF